MTLGLGCCIFVVLNQLFTLMLNIMKKVNILLSLLFFFYLNLFATDYASMYIANGSTDLISGTLSAGSTLQITGYSTMNTSSNWSMSSSSLVPTSSATGAYMLRYTLSFTSTQGLWTVDVYKNGVKMTDFTMKRKNSDASGTDVGNISACGFINISSSSDNITLKVSCDVDATQFTPVHSQISLLPIALSTSPVVGEMYIEDNTTTQTVGTSWTGISNFSSGENLSGFTYSSSQLTLASSEGGYYFVTLSTSFNASGPNDYSFGLSINGATPDKVLLKRRISGNADYGNAVANGIVYLSGDDVVSVKCMADASGRTMDVVDADITLLKINMANSTNYGNMVITNNSSYNNIPSDTWTKEEYFSDGSFGNSDWTFTNSSLEPSSSAIGFYFINFNSAVTYVDAEDVGHYIYPKVAIFVNDVKQGNLICQRKLQKKDHDDYGSISGTGFIRIESTSDVITMRLYSENGKDFLTLDANVNLFKLSSDDNLPINLSYFDAEIYDDFIKLQWTTEAELNNDFFSIERSYDNISYKELCKVKSFGNSNTTKYYSYIDKIEQQMPDIIYYRLKQVDFDGTFTYSNTISVDKRGEDFYIKSIYTDETNISVFLNLEYCYSNINVQLIDISGSILYNKDNELDKGVNNIIIARNKFAKGIYIIKISANKKSIFRKIIL